MVTARNALDKLTAGVSTRANLLSYFNSNLDIIDAALAKCNWNASTDPGAGDDTADGYVVGSWWWNTTGHRLWQCESNGAGAAIWRQVWSTVNENQYVTDPIEVDHAVTSPVSLGTAPANSIVEPIIRCTENNAACVLTIGDEDDADSHCTNAMMPQITTSPPITGPLGEQYYATSKALRATITTPGTAGKWIVQFRITLVV